MNNNKYYHLSDTPEAAYLMNHGVKLVNIDLSQPEAVFVLEETKEGQIGELLIPWESYSAAERTFFKNYRYLLKRIKGNNGQNL